MALRFLSTVLIVPLLASAPAAAQTWRAPPPALAKLGLQAVSCKGEFCLGVACGRNNSPELVSMAPGGGPFNGPATLRLTGVSAQVRFVEDPAIMAALNMLGTRARLPTNILDAMQTRSALTLTGSTYSEPKSTTFGLQGLAPTAAALATACGGPNAQPGLKPAE